MTALENLRRFPVEDGEPIATGIAWVGDALIHTNPIVGRGCTLAAINAFLLADALRAHRKIRARSRLRSMPGRARDRTVVSGGSRADRNAIEVGQMQRQGV